MYLMCCFTKLKRHLKKLKNKHVSFVDSARRANCTSCPVVVCLVYMLKKCQTLPFENFSQSEPLTERSAIWLASYWLSSNINNLLPQVTDGIFMCIHTSFSSFQCVWQNHFTAKPNGQNTEMTSIPNNCTQVLKPFGKLSPHIICP